MKLKQMLTMTAAVALLAFPALAQDAPAAATTTMGAGAGAKSDTMKGGHHPLGIEKLDANGDGKISKDEWMSAQEKKFDEMDTNHDGFIDQNEVHARRDMMKERRKEILEKRKNKDSSAPAPADATK